jgi:hypothetical protein
MLFLLCCILYSVVSPTIIEVPASLMLCLGNPYLGRLLGVYPEYICASFCKTSVVVIAPMFVLGPKQCSERNTQFLSLILALRIQ